MTLVISQAGAAERITRLGAAHEAELLAMHDRCTPRTRYARWHGHTTGIPRGYLAAVTDGDDDHLAVAGWHSGRLVGFASAAIVAPGTREIGILVEDEWQRRGIGGQLLAALVEDIRRLGTVRLRAEVLAEDVGLLVPLAALGAMRTMTSHEVVTAEVDFWA